MSDEHWNSVKESIGDPNINLGPQFAYQLKYTPRHLSFVFSRYKFAGKMIASKNRPCVLELGCGEGVGAMLLAEEASRVVGVDFDAEAIKYAKENIAPNDKYDLQFIHGDIADMDLGGFGVVVSLDVIEHIPRQEENIFVQTIYDHLDDDGFCIIGTPNITADKYASEMSRQGHVNLFDVDRLKALLGHYFDNIFIFGMNDEVLHTGFHPMCHYIMALACNKK